MDWLSGSFTNKIDAKGRVSIPASFRATLDPTGANGIMALRSAYGRYLELRPPAYGSRLARQLKAAAPGTPRRRQLEALASRLFSLGVDSEGRVSISPKLREDLGIDSEMVFAGAFDYVQVWAPSAYAAYQEQVQGEIETDPLIFDEDEDLLADLSDAPGGVAGVPGSGDAS